MQGKCTMSGIFFKVISAEKRKEEEVERPDEARHGFKGIAFEPG